MQIKKLFACISFWSSPILRNIYDWNSISTEFYTNQKKKISKKKYIPNQICHRKVQ